MCIGIVLLLTRSVPVEGGERDIRQKPTNVTGMSWLRKPTLHVVQNLERRFRSVQHCFSNFGRLNSEAFPLRIHKPDSSRDPKPAFLFDPSLGRSLAHSTGPGQVISQRRSRWGLLRLLFQ